MSTNNKFHGADLSDRRHTKLSSVWTQMIIVGVTGLLAVLMVLYFVAQSQPFYDTYDLEIHGCDVTIKYNKITQKASASHYQICFNALFTDSAKQFAFNNVVLILMEVLEGDYENNTNNFAKFVTEYGYTSTDNNWEKITLENI